MALADLPKRVVVAALAVEVDRDHGSEPPARSAPVGDRPVEQRGIDRPRRLVRVHEERCRAGVGDRVRARGEREVRARDLVALADAEHDEREVERGGAARERHGVLDARHRGHLGLERVDVRPERRDPVGLDRLGHELGLASGDVRRGEIDAGHRARA